MSRTAGINRDDRLNDYATAYRDRGLSSDTSIRVNFGIEQALEALRAQRQLAGRSVRRAAIVGPGLDFTDKAQGYDFYPQQTLQPFALIDSLARLGLASDLRVSAFDVSSRVIAHLAGARDRAARGVPYVLHLPLVRDDLSYEWNPGLVSYWQRFGAHIGDELAATVPTEMGDRIRLRAVGIRPPVVSSITPHDLDVVVERFERLPSVELFDLVVATNVLVYYGAFEQALASINLAAMLRPGGLLLTNHALAPAAAGQFSAGPVVPVNFSRRRADGAPPLYSGDTFFWYQRR